MRIRGALVESRGFTLIEIAIVVAIIGLLLLISLPLFSGARNRAYVAEGRVILSEWKSLEWSCLIEKNNDKTKCNTDTLIGWASRPTSQVWDTATTPTITFTGGVGNTDWTSVSVTLSSLTSGPLGAGATMTLSLTRTTGGVTETLSGI